MDPESFLESAIARETASFGGRGGGLCDRLDGGELVPSKGGMGAANDGTLASVNPCVWSWEEVGSKSSDVERSNLAGGPRDGSGKDVAVVRSVDPVSGDRDKGVNVPRFGFSTRGFSQALFSDIPKSLVALTPRGGIGIVDVRLPLSWLESFVRSKKSGSWRVDVSDCPSGRDFGLVAGDTKGDVCKSSGMSSVVSNTKNASPPSPNFIEYPCFTPLTRNST